jgi:HlyD family secretion protein
LLVPRGAVRSDGGQDVVFVVTGDKAERRAVRLGGARNESVEVLSGLAAGERVIVEGPADLADGRRVVVK